VSRLAAGFVLLATVTLAGCRPQAGSPAPTPAPTPQVEVTPSGFRVGVVDFNTLIRAHRRWPELDVLIRKIEAVQFRLASPPQPPDVSGATADVDLQAEAERLRASLRAELDELQAQMRRRVEAFASDLRAEGEATLAEQQRAANVELQKVIEAKRDEVQRELEKFELATMSEYRIPLVNLRLKADVVGISNEEEAKRLGQEADRIQKERDEKIRAKAQALEKQLQEFQQAKIAEAEARFKAVVAAAEEEANARIRAKEAETQAEFEVAVRSREETLRSAMEARRQIVVNGAQAQIRAAQDRYARQLEAEGARLRKEMEALTQQRLRLEDSMIAEIRIEIAAVAQEHRVDAVLMNTVAHPGAVDLTPAVIARLRRS